MSLQLIPSGVVLAYAGVNTTVPEGYLICDGSQVSRTTYSALFAILGTRHGSGDGSTTFHLPDYRGRFLRGTDNMGTGSASRDPNNTTRTAANAGGSTGNNVGTVQSYDARITAPRIPDVGSPYTHEGWGRGPTNSGTDVPTAGTGDGDETRPINVYVNYIIKT